MGEERESNISVQSNITHSRFFFSKEKPQNQEIMFVTVVNVSGFQF